VKSEILLHTRLQPPGQLPPGQLPPRTIATYDNYHPAQLSRGHLPPRTTATPEVLWGGKFLHFIFAFVML